MDIVVTLRYSLALPERPESMGNLSAMVERGMGNGSGINGN